MMMQEFTERTGVTPTFQEYQVIEGRYYAFDGDKDAFCKEWVDNGGPEKLYAARAHRIEQLESCLMEQGRYEHLLAACTPGHGDPRVLTEEEAKQLIHEEFGFDPEMVEIIALIHASTSAEKEIETAAEFPGSDVLQEAGKKAEERKAKIDELAQKMLRNIPIEEWNEKTGTED